VRSRISIALCTFNGASFLDEQLRSLELQERKPDEVIVCDDVSEDDTWHVVDKFRRRAPFDVKMMRNSQRLGVARNFEAAITHCAGDIIFLCDQDDVWHPKKISTLEATFNEDPSASLIFSDALVVDQQLNTLGYTTWQRFGFTPHYRNAVKNGRALELLVRKNFVTGATTAFRSSLRSVALPIPPGWVHDEWLALIAAAVGRIAFVDQQLVKYRQHSNNQIGGAKPGIAERLDEKLQHGSSLHVLWTERYSEVLERIGGRIFDQPVAAAEIQKAKRILEERILHAQRRAQIYGTGKSKLSLIFSELRSLRYFRYSNGIQSAVKDFALGRLRR
jgi:glycosyltransferase involved in cell wall biosynthesis